MSAIAGALSLASQRHRTADRRMGRGVVIHLETEPGILQALSAVGGIQL
jgi:hypothetical protein